MTTRTKKVATISALIAIITVAILSSALYVVQARGNALIREYDILREQATTQNRLDTTFSILEMSKGEREALDQYFLTERGIIDFISQLEAVARRDQVVFETTQLAVEPASDGKQALLKIGFTFSSTLPRVFRFMELLEMLPYHKQIITAEIKQAVNATEASGGDWQGNVIIHLTLIP